MKNKFHGYYTPSAEQFKALWKDALVVLDSSVLLNLYTYSTATSSEIRDLRDFKSVSGYRIKLRTSITRTAVESLKRRRATTTRF
jgi:hypothetical protein